jgi:hypothetical protein
MKFFFFLFSLPIFSGSIFNRSIPCLPKRKSENLLVDVIEKNIPIKNNIPEYDKNLITADELRKRTLINIFVMWVSLMLITFPYKVYD